VKPLLIIDSIEELADTLVGLAEVAVLVTGLVPIFDTNS